MGNSRVLVADGDLRLRAQLGVTLASAGHVVVDAASRTDPAAAAEAMLLHVEAQLVKPVDADGVLAAVDHVLLAREHAEL